MKKKMKRKKTRKKKASGFKEQFKESLKYLAESKNYIAAIIAIFFGGALIGFIFYSEFSFLNDILRELIDSIKGLDTKGLILFIMQNNIRSALFGLILGVFFGILPIAHALSNGVVLGYVMRGVWIESGIREFWRLLPHGIFELPAIFISLGLGLKLGMFIFEKDKLKALSERARKSMILFICIVVPLLVIAAIIEGLLISLYN